MRYHDVVRTSMMFVAGIFLLSSCNSGMGTFQENQSYEYKLFDLLDQPKYQALHDALHYRDPNQVNSDWRNLQCDPNQARLDQCVVNSLLDIAIEDHYEENIKSTAGQFVTINATRVGLPNQYPVQNIVQLMRHLIRRIIDQNTLDNGVFDPNTNQRAPDVLDYASQFFGFLDGVSDKNLTLGGDLAAVMGAMSNYRVDHLNASVMRKETEFALNDITTDATYYAFCNPGDSVNYNQSTCNNHVLANHKLLSYLQTNVGKSNLRADYPMCLNSSNVLIKKSEDMTGCTNNLGLGNAVQGNQSLMMALFELGKDPNFISSLDDLIRQLGVFLSGSVPKQVGSSDRVTISTVAENLVRNIQSYFTTGGANANGIYAADDTQTFSSVELRNTLRELSPGTTRLMLRSDRKAPDKNNIPISLIYETSGKKKYVFDEFITSLRSIGWVPDNARVEESLEDLMRYDQYGRDRTTDPGAQPTSQLESLFFITSAAANYGWTDGCTAHDLLGLKSCTATIGEPGENYNHSHGPARQGIANPDLNPSPTRSTGSTMNDALYAMGTNMIGLGTFGILNQYQVTFNTTDQNHLFRSLYPFTIGGDSTLQLPNKDESKFYFDENYPISYFVTGPVGAPGSPTGGLARNAAGIALRDNPSDKAPALNGYMPFNPIGDNNDNITLSTAVALWHMCWNGAGPYYYDPSKASSAETVPLYGKIWNKVYRASGKLYALVYKAPNGNWEYLFPPNNWDFVSPPNALEEPLYPIAFYVGRIDNPVTLPSDATVNITTDNNTFQATFSKNTTWDRDAIVSSLRNQIIASNPTQPASQGVHSLARFSVIPFGRNKFRIAGSPLPDTSPKIVKIENVSGSNAVELLFGGNGNSIIREQSRAEFWNSVTISDYYMGCFCDNIVGYSCDNCPTNNKKYSSIIRNDNGDIELLRLQDAEDQDVPSGVLTEELLSDTDPNRACASQEEAFFRNYQWFFNERKHLLIMPQRLLLPLLGGIETGIVYIYQESNGFYGFSNARPFRGNNIWAKAGTSGVSTVPGDHRMGVVADFSTVASLLMSGDSVYSDTLGGGPGFSSVLAHNLASLARLAFPTVTSGTTITCNEPNGGTYNYTVIDGLVPSNCFTVGDSTWNKRNALVPILMSIFNALRANTDVQHSNTTGIVPFVESMTILLKPISYYQKALGDAPNNTWKYRVFGDTGNNGYFLRSGGDFNMSGGRFQKPPKWYGSDAERSYFQPAAVNTLFSVLIDSNRYPTTDTPDKKLLDGILPLLVTENPVTNLRPRVLTQALKLLISIGDDMFNDPATVDYNASSQDFDKNFQSWGARRKLFYGLEQSSLLSKNTRGRFTEINDTTLTETLPDWMFTNGVDSNGDGIPDDMRGEEIFANIGQNILVGTNNYSESLVDQTGIDAHGIRPGELGYHMGLAYLPVDWKQNPDKLTLFRTYLEMAAQVFNPEGPYSAVENAVAVVDKFLSQVSPTADQISGLVHTLGSVATTYDTAAKSWNAVVIPTTGGKISFADHPFDLNDESRVDDLYRVAVQYQPIISNIALTLDSGRNLSDIDPTFVPAKGGLTSTINYIYDSSVFGAALVKSNGLIAYVLDVVDTMNDSDHNFSKVFSELYAFLGEPLILNFDSALWTDVAKLMSGMVQVLTRNDYPGAARDNFQNFGFQYNDSK